VRGRDAWLGGLLLATVVATVAILAGRREAPGPANDADGATPARTPADETPEAPEAPTTTTIDGDARPAGAREDDPLAPAGGPDAAPLARAQPRGDRRIEGRVTDAAHRPVVGATVEARALPPPPDGSPPPLTTTTDAEGQFALVGLAAGPWAVLARDAGHTNAAPVVADAGSTGLALSLGTLGWIEGTLRKADDTPLDGAWIVVIAADGGTAPGSVVPVRDGRFRSEGLVAATFRVSARAADARPDAAPTAPTLVVADGRPVAVSDGLATTLDLVVLRGAVLQGRVEDAATGTPLAGVEVVATLDGASATGGRTTATATSAPDGTFELAGLATGRWVVEADSPTHTALPERVTLTAEATETRTLAGVPWTPLRVKVVGEDGRAVDGARVSVQRAGAAVRVRNPDGSRSWGGATGRTAPPLLVPPGELTVVARLPASGWISRPTSVTVVPGVAGEVELVLRPRRTPPPRDR